MKKELELYREFRKRINNYKENVLKDRDPRFSHLPFILGGEKNDYINNQISLLNESLSNLPKKISAKSMTKPLETSNK